MKRAECPVSIDPEVDDFSPSIKGHLELKV
jgi:hypothetical protein